MLVMAEWSPAVRPGDWRWFSGAWTVVMWLNMEYSVPCLISQYGVVQTGQPFDLFF